MRGRSGFSDARAVAAGCFPRCRPLTPSVGKPRHCRPDRLPRAGRRFPPRRLGSAFEVRARRRPILHRTVSRSSRRKSVQCGIAPTAIAHVRYCQRPLFPAALLHPADRDGLPRLSGAQPIPRAAGVGVGVCHDVPGRPRRALLADWPEPLGARDDADDRGADRGARRAPRVGAGPRGAARHRLRTAGVAFRAAPDRADLASSAGASADAAA